MSDARPSHHSATFRTDGPSSGETRIDSAAQYEAALRALSQKTRPPALLRLLMQALEAYRQARRMGWSRKHNKVGVTNFLSFNLGGEMRHFGHAARALIDDGFPDLKREHRHFVDAVCDDRQLMGFLFFQEVQDCKASETTREGDEFESVTLSFGRVVANNKRFRDRWDLILDAPIRQQRVGKLERMRLHVDPFAEGAPSGLVAGASALGDELLDSVSAYFRKHRNDQRLLWDHWTQDYIEYFGPRTRALIDTRFPTELDEAFERARRSREMPLAEEGAA